MADVTIALETATGVEFEPSSSNGTSADVKPMDLHYVIWVFVMPFVLLFGIIGNIFSILVLLSKSFRHTTTGVYLPFTAVADILFLTTGVLEMFEVANIFNAREYNVWICRIYKVLHYTAGDISIWLLVAFTFDRFVAVCFPFSKQRVCKWKRAVIASATIAVLSLGKNLHEFWTRGPEYKDNGELRRICGSQKQYHVFLDYVRPWIAFTLIMAIPFILILIFNCMIVYSLIKAQWLRNKAAAIPASTTPSSATGSKNPMSAGTSFRQTTLMCLSISFAFLICIAPSIVLLIGKPYWKYRRNLAYKNAKAISNFLALLNHCINFFLYCVTGRRFRQELKARLTCRRGEVAQTEISTHNTTITTRHHGQDNPQQVRGQLDNQQAAKSRDCSLSNVETTFA